MPEPPFPEMRFYLVRKDGKIEEKDAESLSYEIPTMFEVDAVITSALNEL